MPPVVGAMDWRASVAADMDCRLLLLLPALLLLALGASDMRPPFGLTFCRLAIMRVRGGYGHTPRPLAMLEN